MSPMSVRLSLIVLPVLSDSSVAKCSASAAMASAMRWGQRARSRVPLSRHGPSANARRAGAMDVGWGGVGGVCQDALGGRIDDVTVAPAFGLSPLAGDVQIETGGDGRRGLHRDRTCFELTGQDCPPSFSPAHPTRLGAASSTKPKAEPGARLKRVMNGVWIRSVNHWLLLPPRSQPASTSESSSISSTGTRGTIMVGAVYLGKKPPRVAFRQILVAVRQYRDANRGQIICFVKAIDHCRNRPERYP